ncbi:hypothetical protein L5515_006985 [Caenorhabditis briggsae]|uniref:F-box domain-containing protein n=1 Tax=Caenorhabditis briggsae TaxID=6238 RepID=A0AAE9F3I7_CAEBR|nr:hypothetical protein L5515_006985 [Caenorhabditis briggsae]
MGKLEPTWQGIPFEIKEVVLKYLEYKSRFRLRVCSKSDKNLIDNSPVFLKQVELYENPLVLRINNNLEMQENVIAHFLEIFKNKINYLNGISQNDIVAEFKEKPEKVRNEQWQFSTEHSCSYIFPVNTKNRIFVLRMRRSGFNGYDIEGYVCTENYTDDEFGKYGSWIPKNHEIVNHRIRRGNFNIVNLANYL